MLYGVLRILFFVVIFILVIILTRSLKYNKKRNIIILTSIFSIVFCTLSYLFPIENIFINFKNPKEIFNYTNIGDLEDVVCGNKSCIIISSSKKYSYSYTFVLKSKKGYKIASSLKYEELINKTKNNNNLTLYKVKNTNDYYVFGYLTSKSKELEISDNRNSEFESIIIGEKSTSRNTYISYGFINNIEEKYSLLVDGEEFLIFNK